MGESSLDAPQEAAPGAGRRPAAAGPELPAEGEVFDVDVYIEAWDSEIGSISTGQGQQYETYSTLGSEAGALGSYIRAASTTSEAEQPTRASILSHRMQNPEEGLDMTDLCAISACRALRNFGEAFRNNDCDPSRHRKEVVSIDDFWSYSRHARQSNIVLMLLVQYNGVPASFAGFGVSAVVAFLIPSQAVTHHRIAGVITLLSGTCAALATLLMWQSRREVFLDKACISQDDEKRKREGILSLGYFLRKSHHMLVLWDGTYLTRLWCVFEFAAFLKLRADNAHPASLKVLPSIYGALAVYALLANAACATLLGIAASSQPGPESVEDAIEVVLVSQTFNLLILGFLGKAIGRLIAVFAGQQEQLQEFSLHSANCFCCSVHHVHPQTKQPLDCDRALITQSVMEWFGSVEAFDQFAQLEVRKHVGMRAHLPLRYVLFVCQVALWDMMGALVWQVRVGNVDGALRIVAYNVVLGGAVAPTLWSLIWRSFSRFFTTRTSQRMSDSRAVACSIALALLFTTLVGLLLHVLPVLFGLLGYVACALILGVYIVIAYRRLL